MPARKCLSESRGSFRCARTRLGSPGGAEVRGQFLSSLMGTELNGDDRAFIEAENTLVEGSNAAALLFDHAFKNWSDVIERFDVPALVIGGKRSLIPWKSMAHIGDRLKSGRTIIFGENEGGSHYMFLESGEVQFRRRELFELDLIEGLGIGAA